MKNINKKTSSESQNSSSSLIVCLYFCSLNVYMLYSFGMEIRYILDIGVLGCEGGVDESQISKYRYKKMTNIGISGRQARSEIRNDICCES